MKEALSSSETSDIRRAARRNVTEDAILHSNRRKNLKSYIISKYLWLCTGLYDTPNWLGE
jgi:hypothetical protein